MSDQGYTRLEASTVRRAARGAVEALLVACIAVQGGLAGLVLSVVAGFGLGREHGEVTRAPLVVAGALLVPFLAGWRVLGGWRGGLRAVCVVLLSAAAYGGTHHSPILADRLRPAELALAAVMASVAAAATSGVALTVIATRSRPASGEGPPPGPPAP